MQPERNADPSGRSDAAAQQTRESIVETAVSLFRRKAFYEVSLESVAAEAGLRRGEVTWYFPTWEDLLKAVVDEWNTRRTVPLLPIASRSGAVALLRAIVRANADDPAMLRFLVATKNIAATPSNPLSGWLRDQWLIFYELVRKALSDDIASGRESSTMQPERGAEQLIALYEGMQTQSLIRRDMDLVQAYDRAVARLREGWATVYVASEFSG